MPVTPVVSKMVDVLQIL
ncbi:hypothetical protein CP8484711_0126A, partial [Chlamydia psittaci 84-8471/1]